MDSSRRSSSFALRSSRVFTRGALRPATVWVADSVIEAIEAWADDPVDRPVKDLGDRVLAPGFVDAHVHVNEPGRTEWEGFATATRAAAAGGITTIVDMPLNSDPVTTTVEALEQKRAAARGQLTVHAGFYGGVVPGNAGDLAGLAAAGVLGFKAFLVDSGIDEFPAVDRSEIDRALADWPAGLPLLVHAEREGGAAAPGPDPRSYPDWMRSRPPDWEVAAIEEMAGHAARHGIHVHIVHVASAEALATCRSAARALAGSRGRLTFETCPHYLAFAAEEIPDGDPRFKCAPPIREAAHRRVLQSALHRADEALADLAFVASDHSPAPPELKALDSGDLRAAWGGIAGLQVLFPATWAAAHAEGLHLERVLELLSSRPAAFLGLEDRGAIEVGRNADLIAIDPDAEWTPAANDLCHRHAVSPWIGTRLRGRVLQTWVDGIAVYEHGHGFPGDRPGRFAAREGWTND